MIHLFESVLQEVLVHFHLVSLLAHFDEGANVDGVALVLHHVVAPIHVNEQVFLLELRVLIPGDVVDEGFLRAAEVAAKNEEFAFFIVRLSMALVATS